MAKELVLTKGGTKQEKYEALIPQIKSLLLGESNLIANMANMVATLKESMEFFWVGFYLIDSETELVLGPFQGPVACTRIKKGKGVCGTSWETNKILIVDDVNDFPGHIACSSASKSEIVLPVKKNKQIIGILDVDSDTLGNFDQVDKKYLKQILDLIT